MAKKNSQSQVEGLASLFSLEEFRAAKANANLLTERKKEQAYQREQRQKIKKERATQSQQIHSSRTAQVGAADDNPLAEMLEAYFTDPLAFSGESEYTPAKNRTASKKRGSEGEKTESGGRISSPREESVLPPIESIESKHLFISGLVLRKFVVRLEECFRDFQKPLDYLGEKSQVAENIGSQMAALFQRLNCELLLLTEGADTDPKWVSEVLAQASLRMNNGLLSLFFAQLWQDLAIRIEDTKITPVILLQWIRGFANNYEKVFLAQVNHVSEGNLLDLLIDLRIELQTQANALSIEDLLLRSWVSAQVSLTDGADENGGRIDPYATVFLLFLAVAAQLYHELTGSSDMILEPTVQMITEISDWENPGKTPSIKYFEISWNGEIMETCFQECKKRLEDKACYGAVAGMADEFGVGERAITLITTRPQGNLKLLPMDCGTAQIKKIFPRRRAFETSPHIDNLVLGNQWGDVAPKNPEVWAFTGAIGLVAEMAEAGVRVFYNPEIKPINLESLLADFEEPLIQLVPGTVMQANLLKQELIRLALRKREYPQVQISPSVNELQLLQLALETVIPVDSHISQKDLELLQQSRCYQALSAQRTWEISSVEDLEGIATGLEDNEEYIRVLVPNKVDSNLLYRLQSVISEKSPGSRVDYINTLVGEHLLLGVLD